MDFFSDIMEWFASFLSPVVSFLSPVSTIPASGVFILFVSVLLTLISVGATNKLTDTEKLKADMEEVKEWQVKFKEARSSDDPQLLQEVMDSQSRIMSLQSSMMTARCKPMLLFYIPFLMVWSILGALYTTAPVIILPFNAQDVLWFIDGWLGVNVPGSGFGMFFWSWYFLCSLGLGNLIRKGSGISMM